MNNEQTDVGGDDKQRINFVGPKVTNFNVVRYYVDRLATGTEQLCCWRMGVEGIGVKSTWGSLVSQFYCYTQKTGEPGTRSNVIEREGVGIRHDPFVNRLVEMTSDVTVLFKLENFKFRHYLLYDTTHAR